MISFDLMTLPQILEVLEIVEDLRNTSSTNEKKVILENNSNNEVLKTILELTYNPHKKYKITEKSLVEVDSNEVSRFKNLLELTHTLTNENINDDLRKQVNLFLRDSDETIRDLYKCILLKDLRIGVNTTTINKVWKGLIPASETGVEIKPMLASKFNFDKPPVGDFAVTEKLDGIRCMAVCTQEGVQLYTRQGKLIEGCVEIEKELEQLRNEIVENFPKLRYKCLTEFVFDGELLATDCSYEDVYKETTKRVKNKNEIKLGLEYKIFDVLHYNQFLDKKCSNTYAERIELLTDFNLCTIHNLEHINLIDILYVGSDTKRLLELLEEYRHKGAEGLMVNLMDAPYEFKRSKNILKVKVMQTADLRIVGFEEGQGRNAGKLGAILVDFKGGIVKVGSGFTDFDREFIWKNQHLYIDRVVEVSYFEVSKDKTGKESLRFPVFKEIREIGKEVSYH